VVRVTAASGEHAADAKHKAEAAADNSATTSDRRTLADSERVDVGPDESLRLQEISNLLIPGGDLDTLYGRVLDAAIGLMSADMGSMQAFYSEGGELRLLAWRGFHPESAAFWERVNLNSACVCGVALSEGRRIIVPDTEACDFIAGTGDVDAFRRSNIRAVQSTPLVSRSGRLLGMISTHWREPHQPTERELRSLDVLARQAADLIERSRVETALRQSEDRVRWLASIVESSDDAIISKDLHGIITSWNKGAERLFGYMAEEAVGKPVAILIPPDRQNEEWMILKRIACGEHIENYETIRERKDGSSIEVSLTISPVKDIEGRIVGASKIARDITERRRAKAREKVLMAEITHMNQMATAGKLSASIAHEVSQPLTGIAARAGAARRWLAADKPDIDRVRDALDQIVAASFHATEVITSFKSLFRKHTDDRAEVDINTLIRTVVGLGSGDLRRHQIKLKMELNDQLPPVLANHVQLQQVILNLVMNAIDAMRPVPSRALLVKSQLNGSYRIHVSIEDTGIGIDPSALNQIFKPLFTTKEHGMGMGLSICRSIIESHNGRIWVSPGENRGSIFQFELSAKEPPRRTRVKPRRSLSIPRLPGSPLWVFLHRQQRPVPPGNSALRGRGASGRGALKSGGNRAVRRGQKIGVLHPTGDIIAFD
jgi:PAS domain S-box-containing protein